MKHNFSNRRRAARLLPLFCAGLIIPQLIAAPAHSAAPVGSEAGPAISRTIFSEPLLPIGGVPSASENRALAIALERFAERTRMDDFSALTGFLEAHPTSAWRVALLTELGFEFYNTAQYSRALDAWHGAWEAGRKATDARAKALADRAAGELAMMYARLGRMTELQALLKSVEHRAFVGAATEKIAAARDALWSMEHRPEISFRCGPLALQRIKLLDADTSSPAHVLVADSASTREGFSLAQVAELSEKLGLNYRMAFRGNGGAFAVPSVVHWKVGHYAALIRREGERYLLQDPTFGNDVWATEAALEAETSGYFLVPSGPLAKGWRSVDESEGGRIWGKGVTSNNDTDSYTSNDPSTPRGRCRGMAESSVHLMLVNLNVADEPIGYSPPVGPEVRFMLRFNQRDIAQPASFSYSHFGPKWTCDWISFITDHPQNPLADVRHYVMGGGTRRYTGFNTNTQTYAFQQYDQTRLTRIAPDRYELLSGDGSRLVFNHPQGSAGTSRRVFLSQIIDPFGNAVTLGYDAQFRLATITDAIGQVTTLAYEDAGDALRVTKVTDPFGRFATFTYDGPGRLVGITDVIGITSQFQYLNVTNNGITHTDTMLEMTTPYGTTRFVAENVPGGRALETHFPDGSRERVEFNQTTNLVAFSEPPEKVPQNMNVYNQWMHGRNTYYWSRNACAQGYRDYSKARIYHWLHTENIATTSGILESTKEPLENRVWFNYPGQTAPYHTVGSSSRPIRVARVLDDGTTQIHSYTYNGFGQVTSATDPLGRRFSYVYSTNGIDLLEVRQARGANNELLARTIYNDRHQPLFQIDVAGQTNSFTYNARGQLLTSTNPKGETTSYTYDTNGYLLMVDGPLPGTNDSVRATYDAFGRTRTLTEQGDYTVAFEYDALDRLTRVTHPDGTFEAFTYNRLDLVASRDRAGRETLLEFDAMRQLVKRTDPLNRVTHFSWCSCGSLRSLFDPMGRATTWHRDVQGRLTAKEYADGSKVSLAYEQTTSRVRQVIDEKQQVKQYSYNRDGTINSISYPRASAPTPSVTFDYDRDYPRRTTMRDGTGVTSYRYHPVHGGPGAGLLASIDGPLPNDTITFEYDEEGHRVSSAINGAAVRYTHDALGRLVTETNLLGLFTKGYAATQRLPDVENWPHGVLVEREFSDNRQDRMLTVLAHTSNGQPLSEHRYIRDVAARRITAWSQSTNGAPSTTHVFSYDEVNQLLTVQSTNSGVQVGTASYTYDPAGNRRSDEVNGTTHRTLFNALNQITASTRPVHARTNEWDAENRLVAVNQGLVRLEMKYDGLGRLASLRLSTNGVNGPLRRFTWIDDQMAEERDEAGAVIKRFFAAGVRIEAGPAAGDYFYIRDHLGSIREVLDAAGNVRARFTYDAFGNRTTLLEEVPVDFGFAGMFFEQHSGLNLTRFRAYDGALGRWLSRDPLRDAELIEGPNLYAYVGNNPVNAIDPLGLCCAEEKGDMVIAQRYKKDICHRSLELAGEDCENARREWEDPVAVAMACRKYFDLAGQTCQNAEQSVNQALDRLVNCQLKQCSPVPCQTGSGAPAAGGHGSGGGGRSDFIGLGLPQIAPGSARTFTYRGGW